MKKIAFLIIFFIVTLINAKSLDILYNLPRVTSDYHYHILQKDRPEKIEEIKDFFENSFFVGLKSPLLSYKTPTAFLALNYKLGLAFAKTDNEKYYQYFYGATLNGNFKNKLIMYSDWWKVQFSTYVDSIHSPLQDSWNEAKSVDNSNTIIKYRGEFFDLFLGRSKFQVGSGISGSVILSDVSDEYPFVASSVTMDKFKFSFMHAALVPDSINLEYQANPSDPWAVKYEDKFLALHKIDYENRGLHFFAGEAVVYGSRSIDLDYILPLAFWRAIEHNLGDRDNMLMFCGLDWQFKEKNIIYFNFNLDDLFKSKLFTSFWGNKYAIQLGYQRIINSKIKFTNEIIAVRPWTYTHKRIVNIFSHNKKPLGYPDGSNLIADAMELNMFPFANFEVVLNYSFIKQGSTGNNFEMNYLVVGDQTTAKAKWLDGDINNIHKFAFSIDYTIFQINSLHAAMEYYKDNDKKNTRISVQYQVKF